jgi:hypothetical protein
VPVGEPRGRRQDAFCFLEESHTVAPDMELRGGSKEDRSLEEGDQEVNGLKSG